MNKLAGLLVIAMFTGCATTSQTICPPPPPAKKQQLELQVDPELMEPPAKLKQL